MPETEILKKIKASIKKAKQYADLSASYQQKVFNLLEEVGIDADSIETKAENADDLQQAITCYISYGEYSLNEIMKEIENAVLYQDNRRKVLYGNQE